MRTIQTTLPDIAGMPTQQVDLSAALDVTASKAEEMALYEAIKNRISRLR